MGVLNEYRHNYYRCLDVYGKKLIEGITPVNSINQYLSTLKEYKDQ